MFKCLGPLVKDDVNIYTREASASYSVIICSTIVLHMEHSSACRSAQDEEIAIVILLQVDLYLH